MCVCVTERANSSLSVTSFVIEYRSPVSERVSDLFLGIPFAATLGEGEKKKEERMQIPGHQSSVRDVVLLRVQQYFVVV